MEFHVTMSLETNLFLSASDGTTFFITWVFRGSSQILRRIMGYCLIWFISGGFTDFIKGPFGYSSKLKIEIENWKIL